jgi:SAM-dependent methyltransferase
MSNAADRFAFGKNWASFIEHHFDDERVAITQTHLLKFLGRGSLEGLTFLDIGCGSGLHSLAAYRAGAARVISFDYDHMSVGTTRKLRALAGDPENWQVLQGSVLDADFMAGLGQFDIVYSWGVLHHTGDQWTALKHAAARMGAGGLFYVALYTSDVFTGKHDAAFWLRTKRRYNEGGWLVRRGLEFWYAAGQLYSLFRQGSNPIAYVANYRNSRGMSYYHDVKDWVGGWPMEFSSVAEIKAFGRDTLGLDLADIKTGEANTEYLFRRPIPAEATGAPAPGAGDVLAGFLDRCRAEWHALAVDPSEQRRFDLAEALAGLVYPKYRFSEFGRLYFDEPDFFEFYVTHVAKDNFHSYDRKYFLQNILKLIDRVPGDTAECGAYHGAGSLLICRHVASLGRTHHVFDSFEGLSAPEPVDGIYWSAGAMAVDEAKVRETLAGFDNVEYHPGWIPERFADVAETPFSFVHIDVDLYGPTNDSVQFFYPRMARGGILLFDDYGFQTCPGARLAIDTFFADKPEHVIDLPTGQAMVVVGS